MERYIGLDVSLKSTAICIVDAKGKIVREGVVTADPEAIAAFIAVHAPEPVRIGLESGATSTWLWTELKRLGLPVICIDARHAKAALKMQINKSDRNDAIGIARIIQAGWYKEVCVKSLDSHAVKALLTSRALLVKIKRDLENQIRGLLKNFGLIIGRAKQNTFTLRAGDLLDGRPELAAAIEPLLQAREATGRQIVELDSKVRRLAKASEPVRRLMTAPGVGPITALCFLATIDDPRRFARSRNVGALSRPDDEALCLWRDRLDGADLEMRRCHAAQLSVRSRQCAAHPHCQMVSAKGLGHAARQAQQPAQSKGCRGP
jgi:transposase